MKDKRENKLKETDYYFFSFEYLTSDKKKPCPLASPLLLFNN